jgi:hypothetical protein
MTLSRSRAVFLGMGTMGAVVVLHAINSLGCLNTGFDNFLNSTTTFLAVPLLPALVSLAFPNPLRAVGACALLVPWLLLALLLGCVVPDSGGAAPMAYVLVVFLGTPSAILGALITGPAMRRLGIEVPTPPQRATVTRADLREKL